MCVVICLLAANAFAQQQSVHAELSATTITRDDTVNLTIVAVGLDEELDISALDKDFEVVGRSSSRQVSTVIGPDNKPEITSEVRWVLELVPRGVGVFTIPSVKVGNVSSQLLTLTVNDVPTGARRDVFVTASVDTETPWVQSQVILTLEVYQAIDIVDGGLDIPSGNDLVVERIGDDTRRAESVDGRQYSVTTRKFALFAQKSGVVQIEPITLSVSVPADPSRVRGFFSPTRKLTRRTDPITLSVQARPTSGAAWWLPAQAVALESQWAGDVHDARVDQPLTRSITLRASGVLDSQMPDINIPAIEGASLYAEEPQRATGHSDNGLFAEQVINWAVIPQRAGTLKFPAVTVEWFNTRTGQTETAVLPEETITVAAAASPRNGVATDDANPITARESTVNADGELPLALSDNAASPLTDNNQAATSTVTQADNVALSVGNATADSRLAALERSAQQWRLGAMAAVLLWLFTSVLLLASRRRNRLAGELDRQEPAKGEASAVWRDKAQRAMNRFAPLADVERACQSAQPVELRQALLAWAERQWPDSAPQSLTALAAMLPVSDARSQIIALDASLYSRSGGQQAREQIVADMGQLPEFLKQAVGELGQPRHSAGSVTASKGFHSLPEL